MQFDIKAQPLSEALMAFGAQTGAIVMASSELTTGKTSNPVTGQLTSQEALTRLLQGTGLKFEMSPSGTVLISGPPQSGSQVGTERAGAAAHRQNVCELQLCYSLGAWTTLQK